MLDDCSTDKSPKIMAEYAAQYANILLLKTPENSGAAGLPRNTALEHVQEPYIMFLDPDDFLAPDACGVLYKKIRETGVQIVGGYCDYVDENGEKRKSFSVFPKSISA